MSFTVTTPVDGDPLKRAEQLHVGWFYAAAVFLIVSADLARALIRTDWAEGLPYGTAPAVMLFAIGLIRSGKSAWWWVGVPLVVTIVQGVLIGWLNVAFRAGVH